MEEIETFLNELALQLKEIKRSEKNPVVVAQKHFEYGQFLLSVGKHKESVELLHFSWNALKNFKYDEIYGGLFYSTGVTYAGVLDYLGDIAECERIYAELNTFNAEGFHLGDYAYFLHRRKRDFDNAERAYVKALSLFPSHSSIHLKYAGFLRHVRKNVTKAEEQYKRAIEVNPMNADAIGNYASFLHGVHRNIADAEISYRRAVELDDSHANNLCNYGLFLSEEKSNYEESEKMYQRVLQLTPTHTNTLYNYAVLLDTHLKRKEEAEQYYRLTLDIESRHAYALYNIAVLLEEKYFNSHEASDPPMSEEEKIQDKKHKVEEVTTFYRRAAESDSKDAATIADFGRFIYLHGDNSFQAEAILIAALRINPKSEVALYYLSLLHYKEKPDKAEVMLSELLKISPNHTNANITLSRLLVEKLKSASVNNAPIEQRFVEKVIQMYETVITSSNKESESIVQEYLRFVSEFGSPEQKSHAIKSITPILSRFQRSETKYTRRSSQDLSANINGAAGVNNSSPNPRARRKPLTEVIANCFELLNEIKEQI